MSKFFRVVPTAACAEVREGTLSYRKNPRVPVGGAAWRGMRARYHHTDQTHRSHGELSVRDEEACRRQRPFAMLP